MGDREKSQQVFMNKLLLFSLSTIFLLSCFHREQPTLVYDEDGDIIVPASANDSTDIERDPILDLPIRFDSINFLLHPVGQLGQLKYKGKFRSEYGSGSQTDFSLSQSWENSISGLMCNIIFEDLRTGTRRSLTEQKIEIRKIHYANELFEMNGSQYLVYQVIDFDTNQDQLLNDKDIKSLYLSNIDGSEFRKLNKDLSEVIAWKILPRLERMYFRTVEDSNKNGDFDKDDRFSNYYGDLSSTSSKKIIIQPYNFLELNKQ